MDNLDDINRDVVNCEKCDLYKERINPVLGAGNPKARIMFVGEAPGASEDRSGVPFCGKAGIDDEYPGFLNGAATCVYGLQVGFTGFTSETAQKRRVLCLRAVRLFRLVENALDNFVAKSRQFNFSKLLEYV